MDKEIKVKNLSKLFKTCNTCGLPDINCVCRKVKRIKTNTQFWILSSYREFFKPSNTARLMKLINPESTEIFLWERTVKPEGLCKLINSGEYDVYVLFPAGDLATQSRKVQYTMSSRPSAFILLDGTWKEARRILNKSDYLKDIPIVSLEPGNMTKYDLRRGLKEGNLCTIEAAIDTLKLTGEHESAKVFEEGFDLFLRSYRAGASGHKLSEH